MGKKKNYFYSSLGANMDSYYYYLSRFSELSMAMFDYKGLPETVDPTYLELAFFEEGKIVVFEDDALGMLGLSVVYQGPFNAYGYPYRRRAISRYSKYQQELTSENSVLIFNNLLRLNTFPTVRMFAQRLWNLDRIVDVNANAQKTPILVQCDENQRLTAENMYLDFDGNKPVIFARKGFNREEMLAVLKTDAPFIADKIYQLKCNIFNEVLTYLGIPNSIVNKKERQFSDEVQRDLGGTLASRYSRLLARQRGFDLVNRMFGTNISVEYQDFDALGGVVQDTFDAVVGGGENE